MPASAGQPAVLFDLDGTLTDPFVGISRSVQYAFEKMGRPVPLADDLRAFIGPPLHITFAKLLDSDDAAVEAVGFYRERYGDVGKFENELIPGITDAVAQIVDDGYFLAVATSKLESFSVDIVEHFGLGDRFAAVHGSRPDGSNSNKAELIAHIIATEDLDPSRCVMIGDRLHDVVGAKANGVPTIGVLWGFGDRAELEGSGAACIAQRPDELPDLIRQLLPAEPGAV